MIDPNIYAALNALTLLDRLQGALGLDAEAARDIEAGAADQGGA